MHGKDKYKIYFNCFYEMQLTNNKPCSHTAIQCLYTFRMR